MARPPVYSERVSDIDPDQGFFPSSLKRKKITNPLPRFLGYVLPGVLLRKPNLCRMEENRLDIRARRKENTGLYESPEISMRQKRKSCERKSKTKPPKALHLKHEKRWRGSNPTLTIPYWYLTSIIHGMHKTRSDSQGARIAMQTPDMIDRGNCDYTQ